MRARAFLCCWLLLPASVALLTGCQALNQNTQPGPARPSLPPPSPPRESPAPAPSRPAPGQAAAGESSPQPRDASIQPRGQAPNGAQANRAIQPASAVLPAADAGNRPENNATLPPPRADNNGPANNAPPRPPLPANGPGVPNAPPPPPAPPPPLLPLGPEPDPHRRVTPTVVGSVLQVPPHGSPVEKAIELQGKLDSLRQANASLNSRLRQLEDDLRARDQLLKGATGELQAAAGEISSAREQMRRWVEEARREQLRLRKLDQGQQEQLRAVIRELEKALESSCREPLPKPTGPS